MGSTLSSAPTQLLDLHHPILDIIETAAGSSIFWVTMDLARGDDSSIEGAETRSIVRIQMNEKSVIELVEEETTDIEFEELMTESSELGELISF